MSQKILIVDDDEELRSELRDYLDDYDVVEASDGRLALKILERANEIGAVILDVMMPGLNGIDVLTEIKRIDPNLGIVILTGHSSKEVAIEALQGQADDYIEKPADIPKIKESIERLLKKRHPEDEIDTNTLEGKIAKVKQFTEKNVLKKISLNDAAQAVCLSPKYLSRAFKEATGQGYSDFRLDTKIKKAKELLAKSGYNVDQISDKLGYENTESFIRQFKKRARLTPTEYRNKLQKKKGRKKSRTGRGK